MEEEIQLFITRLSERSLTDEYIIEEKLKKFEALREPRLLMLLNHQFFASSNRVTDYLRRASEDDSQAFSEPIRKRLYRFIASYVAGNHRSIHEHVGFIFEQMVSLTWKERGTMKQHAIKPLSIIIEVYEEEFLLKAEILDPEVLHSKISDLVRPQNKCHIFIAECWYLLAVIQSKFPHQISPTTKKRVQEETLRVLKRYVSEEKYLNAIALLNRAFAKSLRENYLQEKEFEELFRHVLALIPATKSTYAVHLSALELLSERKQLFHRLIMATPTKLFSILKEGANHKNKDYKIKSMEVLIEIVEEIAKGILIDRQRQVRVFYSLMKQISDDFYAYDFKPKSQMQERNGLDLLTVVRLLSIMSPLYYNYEGKRNYVRLFDNIIKKCARMIRKEARWEPSKKGFEIVEVLYAQKTLYSFILSLANMIDYLDDIDYPVASLLEEIFIAAVKESAFFLPKYLPDLWLAMVQLINSLYPKGLIFDKWCKKVVSESLKECLDSKKHNVSDDSEYVQMIAKATQLWRSLLLHNSWNTNPQHEFTELLLANIHYLILNLNCGYRARGDGEPEESFEGGPQEEEIVQIFYMSDERIEVVKVEDYQYLSSLSLLFHEVLDCVDHALYNKKLSNFYPQLLDRIRLYPKCLPLLRTLRSLNEFILRNGFFRTQLGRKPEYSRQLIDKMAKFFHFTLQKVYKFQEQYFYEMVKLLLSFPQELYCSNNYRILKSHIPKLLAKALEIGQEVPSLASAALRCTQRIFRTERAVAQGCLLPVIACLEKYVNLASSEREEFKSQLFLFEQELSRKDISNAVLTFLGSMGGLCHSLVNNSSKDHISWDYDCELKVTVEILKEPFSLNLVRMLDRVCWLSINGKEELKVVACELLHAKMSFVIEEVVSNKMGKENVATFLDRTLPTVLAIASNTSHPSQQLLHTLLIQLIHFFANTKQPNSPDVQVILKHLLALYSKSEDMAFIASKCLSEFVRWHIKQQPQKNGDVPILKALINNIWSLLGNRNAREGIIAFLLKLLKIVHREEAIMRYYSLEFGSLLLSLGRSHAPLEPDFRCLIEKYTACVRRYIRFLIINEPGRRYKKTPTVHDFLAEIYSSGFFSIYAQQREAAFLIWVRLLRDNSEQLGYSEAEFLKVRANKEKKYLFGKSYALDFGQSEEADFGKDSRRLVGLGEVWLRMLKEKIFLEGSLIQFMDLECVYLVSFVSFLHFLKNSAENGGNTWPEDVQESIILNLKTFLRLVRAFSQELSLIIVGKLCFNLSQTSFSERLFHSYLLNVVFRPDSVVKQMNRDILAGPELTDYLHNLVNYFEVRDLDDTWKASPLERAMEILEKELGFGVKALAEYFWENEQASERTTASLRDYIRTAYKYEAENRLSVTDNPRLSALLVRLLEGFKEGKAEREYGIISFVLSFAYEKTAKFVVEQVGQGTSLFSRYERQFVDFLVGNWERLCLEVISLAMSSVSNVKMLYILLLKLSRPQKAAFLALAQHPCEDQLLPDLLRINFLLAKQLDLHSPAQQQRDYLAYLEGLIERGLRTDHLLQVQEEALYLSGLLINERLRGAEALRLGAVLEGLSVKYVPLGVSKQQGQQKQELAMRFFKVLRNLVVISEDFYFIRHFMVQLKDEGLSAARQDTIEGYIEDCVRTCFRLEGDGPLEWAKWLLQYYWDSNCDSNHWLNFRLLIVEKIFRKAVGHLRLDSLQRIYEENIKKLSHELNQPLLTHTLRDFVLDMQIKKGAFLLVELLYGHLPRHEKKEGVKPENEYHKIFIKQASLAVKQQLEPQKLKILKDYDQQEAAQGMPRKAYRVLIEYNCYAYNCLMMLFLATQSNPKHFTTFLFETNQALWDSLVDTTQTKFNFEIETNFRVLQPDRPTTKNATKDITAKIQKNYFECSLHIVPEEDIPQPEQQQQDAPQTREVPIKNAHNILPDSLIEEDEVNKHPCMMNLLRVVDFLHTNFPEEFPSWMKPIEERLEKTWISLGERVLLLKLLLNRPNVFHQEVWAKHLLHYLAIQQNGGDCIHYFHRDVLKRFLKFLPAFHFDENELHKLNRAVQKSVRSLPHHNPYIFSDNIDLLERMLRVPGAYVQKNTIRGMLKKEKDEKDEYNWRMCAIVTLKLCLIARTPVLTETEYSKLMDSPERFCFFYKEMKGHLKLVYEHLVESSQQLRLAAAGFLGEFLSFIFTSSLEEHQKKEYFKSVSQFLVGFLEKGNSRSTKEKFSQAIEKISVRFPQLLADEQLFSIFLDSLSQFSGAERRAMLAGFQEFSRSLLAFNELSQFTNFFIRFRAKHREIISDCSEVKLALLQLLNLCTDHRLLSTKDVFYSFDFTLSEMDCLKDISEQISQEYYQLLIRIKHYLIDPEAKQFEASASLLERVEKRLIQGLSSRFEGTARLLFEEFQKEAAEMLDANDIDRFLRIMHKLYNKESEGEWLVNVVPILLTLCRKSSNYSRPLTQTKLEENMLYYDWDFRNFKIHDSSLPYTPFSLLPDRRPVTQLPSQGQNLRGMIRATQQGTLSQEEQIFTLLESLSSQEPGSQDAPLPQQQPSEEKYHRINDLFRNKRRRNEAMDTFKQNNIGKIPSAVQFVEDRIRFAKNFREEDGAARRWMRREERREKVKKGALLRAYKIGQLPNIEISLSNLFEPLIFLAARDSEIASEVFLQLVAQLCAARSAYCTLLHEFLGRLLSESSKFNFSFVSTLEKCIISICQKNKMSFDLSLKKVALHSSTLDYAIIFTEENIIQLIKDPAEPATPQALAERQRKLEHQWYDLAEYYQMLNELDMVESVLVKIADEQHRPQLVDALKRKKDGELVEARKLIEAIMEESSSQRLHAFLEKEKIDCAVLLSEWEDICADSASKLRRGDTQTAEEMRMFTIAIENSPAERRPELLELLRLEGDKYEYERGLVSVMRGNQLDMARFHSLNAREVFRSEWEKVSSFAYKSKHELLQCLQKNYELIEFLDLFKRPKANEGDCEELFDQWNHRRPDSIFDDNITWIQILSSRSLFGGLLGARWGLSGERMARHSINWLVQVVSGMIDKGELGYAQNAIRTALRHHQRAKEFNWQLYESIAQLKLMQTVKRRSVQLGDYEIVPKLIQREMDKHNFTSLPAKFQLLAIRNQYLEGFLEVCLERRTGLDSGAFVMQAYNVLRNYEQIRQGLRQHSENDEIDPQFHKTIHFRFAMFLDSLLGMVRGKFEVKEVRESLEKFEVTTRELALRFVDEVVLSVKLSEAQQGGSLEWQQGQQLFAMILKLVKIVQAEHAAVGKRFEDAVNDRHIPKWIFLYFIPQIIRNINDFDISLCFGELFDHLLNHYPEALVYPFNCLYPTIKHCHTELTKYLFEQLHAKMGRYFDLIDNLFLLQHPELRLKDLLTKYHQHGEAESANDELKQFISPNDLLGKYNQRFNQSNRAKITHLLELKDKGQAKELSEQIKAYIAALDPSKSSILKYFSKLSDGSYWFEDYNCSDWARLEVPGTAYCQFEEPHPWNKVYIESFDSSLLTLTSIRRPKRVTLLGSNEKVYMLLVKGGEDVRLDQRVEQLFELVNRIMDHNTDTNKKQLQVRRFEVIPMRQMFGVFEWVDKSKTLRTFLEAELKEIEGRPEANLSNENKGFAEFHRYFKKLCPNSDDRHVWHRTLMARPESEVLRNFGKCEAGIPYGLLRFGLEKLAKNYDSFLHLKNKFLSNYSAICLVTYLFGIGDRHLENFLIQTSTGSLVMIDFGYSFGASIELPIPELIPFRFTKSMRELAAPAGIEGAFKKCMVSCFEALNKKMSLIVDYCDVFVDDPLMEWVWVSRRQLQNPPQRQIPVFSRESFSVSQEAPERKLFSNKIKMVENKLKGHNPRQLLEVLLSESRHKSAQYFDSLKTAIWKDAKSREPVLGSEELVRELFSLATDKNIQGRSYLGLNLYV